MSTIFKWLFGHGKSADVTSGYFGGRISDEAKKVIKRRDLFLENYHDDITGMFDYLAALHRLYWGNTHRKNCTVSLSVCKDNVDVADAGYVERRILVSIISIYDPVANFTAMADAIGGITLVESIIPHYIELDRPKVPDIYDFFAHMVHVAVLDKIRETRPDATDPTFNDAYALAMQDKCVLDVSADFLYGSEPPEPNRIRRDIIALAKSLRVSNSEEESKKIKACLFAVEKLKIAYDTYKSCSVCFRVDTDKNTGADTIEATVSCGPVRIETLTIIPVDGYSLIHIKNESLCRNLYVFYDVVYNTAVIFLKKKGVEFKYNNINFGFDVLHNFVVGGPISLDVRDVIITGDYLAEYKRQTS